MVNGKARKIYHTSHAGSPVMEYSICYSRCYNIMAGSSVSLYHFCWTKFLKRAISKMHKSAGCRLGKISNQCENKFFDINIICGLKRKFRHFRHCLAGCHFRGFTKKPGNCHNAQFQSFQMYHMHKTWKNVTVYATCDKKISESSTLKKGENTRVKRVKAVSS